MNDAQWLVTAHPGSSQSAQFSLAHFSNGHYTPCIRRGASPQCSQVMM
jgi:hypothetical protein